MEPDVNTSPESAAMSYRDSTSRRLTDYPHPAVAVDTAVLTVQPLPDGRSQLAVLQVRRSGSHRHGSWALPGTFLHQGERLIDAAHRSLQTKAGIDGVTPTQLHVFDDPDRDERGWVLSVAHLDALPHTQLVDALHARDDIRLAPASAPDRCPTTTPTSSPGPSPTSEGATTRPPTPTTSCPPPSPSATCA